MSRYLSTDLVTLAMSLLTTWLTAGPRRKVTAEGQDQGSVSPLGLAVSLVDLGSRSCEFRLDLQARAKKKRVFEC